MPRSDSVASFIPGKPARVLVLAHGFPWADDSQSDDFLLGYARAAVQRWAPFAETHHAIILAPVFGGRDFGGYRELAGRRVDADEFVNELVDAAAREHIPHFGGQFSLHGHSAGAQFAARYLVTHPERLAAVVLSAPSAYAFPDPALPWPNGMAAVVRNELSGTPADGKPAHQAAGSVFIPPPGGWLTAASEVPVSVLVRSRDTEPARPSPDSTARAGLSGPSRGSAACAAMPRPATGHPRSGSSWPKGSTTTRWPWRFPLRRYWP